MRIKRPLALLVTCWLLGGCECRDVCELQRVHCEEDCRDEYERWSERAEYDFCMASCASQEAQCANGCTNGS